MIIEAGFLSWGHFPSWKFLRWITGGFKWKPGCLQALLLTLPCFFFHGDFRAARAAPGTMPGTGRVFFHRRLIPDPGIPSGMHSEQAVPSWEGRGEAGLLPSFPFQSSPGKKGIWSSGGRRREKMLPNPTAGGGRWGIWGFGMAQGAGMVGGCPGIFCFSQENPNAFHQKIVFELFRSGFFSPFPREGENPLNPGSKF